MRSKALARPHPVFIDHAQAAETAVFRVMIAGKREGMRGVQSAVIEMAALLRLA